MYDWEALQTTNCKREHFLGTESSQSSEERESSELFACLIVYFIREAALPRGYRTWKCFAGQRMNQREDVRWKCS